ncbi:MAG: methyl-accepting chemotaxis protein [Oscillospiraceae bacterium]|jgi:methyl-accepting chemotaxis protein|nr:methyl-accepting chemotaxis protein [Oscillospiraceae bacterium]
MKNLKIKSKLLTSFIIIAAVAVIVGVVGIIAATSLTSSGKLLNDRATIGISAASMQSSVYEQRSATLGIALYTALFELDHVAQQKTDLQNATDEVTKLLTTVNQLAATDETKSLIKTIENQRVDYAAAKEAFIKAVDAAALLDSDVNVGAGNGMESAIAVAVAAFSSHINDYVKTIEALSTAMNSATDEQYDSMESLSTIVTIILIAVVIVAAAAAIIIAFYISSLIVPPLSFITRVLKEMGGEGKSVFSAEDWKLAGDISLGQDEIAQSAGALGQVIQRNLEVGEKLTAVANGDLTVSIAALAPHDTMGTALAKMIDNLNMMFHDINDASSEVSSGAGQISDSAQSLAQGSTEQAATVQELSASIQDVASKTKENSEMANNAASLANSIKVNAEKGDSQMREMTKAVEEINQASQNISKVIKVIDDIAFQTNILALNAAVEAARAGEAGKGFAVVADEVRNLASKSAAAAKETGELIENSMKKAELGAQIAAATATSLSEIVSGINESSVVVAKIADSSEEQTTAITQINEAIEQVSEVVQRNSATAEESAASSEELNAQSNILARNVAKFKLK